MPEFTSGIRAHAAKLSLFGIGAKELAALASRQPITYDVHGVWDRLAKVDSQAARTWAKRHGPGLPHQMDSPAIYEYEPITSLLRRQEDTA